MAYTIRIWDRRNDKSLAGAARTVAGGLDLGQ